MLFRMKNIGEESILKKKKELFQFVGELLLLNLLIGL